MSLITRLQFLTAAAIFIVFNFFTLKCCGDIRVDMYFFIGFLTNVVCQTSTVEKEPLDVFGVKRSGELLRRESTEFPQLLV